ncbi:hypothetical protein SERLA73DRAFT_171354 [Serpula lacrymans var. lacrymans S7.3]|uniref:Uncharacterized protein n=2 Tax=Serpula lacrymans var. lacrymans TaxID=341189 RepID=F8QAV1_SERL3|nr:uncharacterized protein SERLADRAFT_478186 [Serpula lacrymans var. lacrymans S7.9]EGN94337.1 hypothetical protein SERLA73DRAFT_171354 [Serpula lacrymans var. lacrymans S7.3]EGO19824.1 hypothetical protein SERLADRAFT_478186 [Serpula lacrymans var. lacrymans S7.9]
MTQKIQSDSDMKHKLWLVVLPLRTHRMTVRCGNGFRCGVESISVFSDQLERQEAS